MFKIKVKGKKEFNKKNIKIGLRFKTDGEPDKILTITNIDSYVIHEELPHLISGEPIYRTDNNQTWTGSFLFDMISNGRYKFMQYDEKII